MADEVQIKFSADIGGALSALNALKQAAVAASDPAARFSLPTGRPSTRSVRAGGRR